LPVAAWASFLVDLALPALILAALFAIRPWFLAVAGPPPASDPAISPRP
jgi:hypothetical protein